MTAFLQEEEREKREQKQSIRERAKDNSQKQSIDFTTKGAKACGFAYKLDLKVKYPFVIDARVNSMLTACSVCGY